MKTKVFLAIGIAAFAVAMAFNVNAGMKKDAQKDLILANVDALATGESGSAQGTLYGNQTGTRFCCCPGNNNCAAAACSGC